MTDYILGVPGEGERWVRYFYYDVLTKKIRVRIPGEEEVYVLQPLNRRPLDQLGQTWYRYTVVDDEGALAIDDTYIVRESTFQPPLALLVGCRQVLPMCVLEFEGARHYIMKNREKWGTLSFLDDDNNGYNNNTLEHALTKLTTHVEKKQYFSRIMQNLMYLCLQLLERRIGFVDVMLDGINADATVVMDPDILIAIDEDEEGIITPGYPYSNILTNISAPATRLIQSFYACIYLATQLAVQLFGTNGMEETFNDIREQLYTEALIKPYHPLLVFYEHYEPIFRDQCSPLYMQAISFLKSIGEDPHVMTPEDIDAMQTEAVLRHWLEFNGDF